MFNIELPYKTIGDAIVTVTTTPSVIDLGCRTCVLHNTGANILYFSAKTVSVNSPELAVGEKTFPRTGLLNVVSAGTSTIKIEYIDAIG